MIAALLIGVLGGVIAGTLGVGGGVVFVPALVVMLGLSQQPAEATSLLAIAPAAIAGAALQDRHGQVRRRDAAVLATAALPRVAGGIALANAVSGTLLRDAFAVVICIVALRLALAGSRRTGGAAPVPGQPRPPAG